MNDSLNKTLKLIPLGAALALGLAAGSSQAAPASAGPGAPPAYGADGRNLPPPHFGGPRGARGHAAHFGGAGFEGHRGPRSAVLQQIRRLDLSDAQDDKIDAILVKHHSEQRELFKRGRELRRSYEALDPFAKDYVSQSAKLADQRAALTRDSLKLRAKIDSEVIATLTPEQTQKLQAEREARKAGRAEHRGHQGPRGPQPPPQQ